MAGQAIWVFDTSALGEIRAIVGKAGEKAIFQGLTELLQSDALVYPSQVVAELEKRGGTDPGFLPYHWARLYKKQATRFEPVFEEVRRVLEHPQTRHILDPNKPDQPEEADPYILAMAIKIKKTGDIPTVISQEIKDRAGKMSIASACGLHQLLSLRVEPFLVDRGLLEYRDRNH